ncbi:MAG: pentapeptide repeat-containing protein, partial [Nitrospirae bacterium]|nr:pentapeptide repeat-containing protein [Nitrospirota bacterium]
MSEEITQGGFNSVLEEHQKWLNDPDTGERAILRYKKFNRLNIGCRNLSGADFVGSDLTGVISSTDPANQANLKDVILKDTILKNAKLKNVSFLKEEQLSGADLTGAELPENIKFESLEYVNDASKNASR